MSTRRRLSSRGRRCLPLARPRSRADPGRVYAQPDAVLNGVEVECLTNPGLARRRAPNRKNACDILSFLVVRDSRLPVITLHRHPDIILQIAAATRASSWFDNLTRVILTVLIKFRVNKFRVKRLLMEPGTVCRAAF